MHDHLGVRRFALRERVFARAQADVTVLRTVVDPATGLPRAATAADLARGAGEHPYPQREAAGAEVVVHPDGMKSAVLDASFRSMSVAKI
ncbi:hypothetical protein HGA89_06595, partial [bacterium]|nr:hypothetical protein [bacterium]